METCCVGCEKVQQTKTQMLEKLKKNILILKSDCAV